MASNNAPVKRCRYCNQVMDQECVDRMKRTTEERRAQSMQEVIARKRAAGERMGRKRVYDYDKICAMRDSGMSIKQVADAMGIQRSTVCNATKARKKKNAGNSNL